MQEVLRVSFVFNRGPLDDEGENPIEGKPRLTQEGKKPDKTMVSEGKETINKETDEEEQNCNFLGSL